MKRRELVGGMAALGAAMMAGSPGGARMPLPQEWTPAEFHARRRFLETPFGRIAYVEQGAGPVALLLHGWPLNGYQWRGAIARLKNVRRCVAPDFMGLGYSDVPADADLSPMQQMGMILSLLDRLDIGRADIISNDSGTGVALLLAAHHPERVRSLLLTNGDVDTNSPPAILAPTLEEARTDKLVARFDRQLADNRLARTDEGLGVVYTNPSILTPTLVETYLRPLVSSPKRRRQGQDYGLAFVPSPLPAAKAKLQILRAPARMVWGTADPLFPSLWAYWLDRTLPESRGVRLVHGAKLFFPEEYPQIIASEARKLWAA